MSFRTASVHVRWATVCVIAALLTLGGASSADAQNYRFRVAEMDLEVHIQPDASARIEYRILFRNATGAHAIDIVDIGLPHRDYSISNMSASIDESPISNIRKSTYIDIGVEAHLGGRQIRSGQEGTFRFSATMPDMVYQDTTDSERASFQMIPTWFDPQLQTGTTHLRIAVHLPPGVDAGEITWHTSENRYQQMVKTGDGEQQHVVVGWDYPTHRLSSNNPKIGVSFPKRVMDRVVKISILGLFVKWFSEDKDAQIISGVALGVLLLITFLRFSHGTGWVLALILVGGLAYLMYVSPKAHLISWPVVIGICVLNERALRKRRSTYLPAIAEVEGGGIKRGLTAPQAAILLELPLGKVLTLVIFGLLKKGIVTMTSADPFTVEVAEEYRGTLKSRLKNASKAGVVVHDYEHPFLVLLAKHAGTPVQKIDMKKPLMHIVTSTATRMKGFDLSDTVAYYRRIVERAWREADSIPEIELRSKTVDRNFDWMMIDPNWERRFGGWGTFSNDYRPTWTSTSRGGHASPSSAPSGGGSSLPTPSSSKTSFGEVASSFAGWAENTSGQLASVIEPGSLGLGGGGARGLVDLSAVDRVTADIFEGLAEAAQSSGGGGGGGGGCACACAGCACACACAGGGR